MSFLVDQYYVFRVRSYHDAEAFARLYDRHAASLYRFAYLKLSSRELAEELVADIFSKFWDRLQKQGEVRHVRGLLYQMLRNGVIDAYRRRQGIVTVPSVTFEQDETSSYSDSLSSDLGRGSEQTEARAEVALLLEKIRGLKEDYQDVLMLRLIEDLSFQEIASVLEKETGAVRVLFHRARKALEL